MFLSIGTTNAILALLKKVEVLILLLMAIGICSAKMSDANLTSLVSILSVPEAFFEFRDFRVVFHFVRRYLRIPTGRRHRNKTGLFCCISMDFYNARVMFAFA